VENGRLNDLIVELTRDPLSETTRKERKGLLGVSVLAVIIGRLGIIPEKISALGVNFSIADKGDFLHILAAIVFYFLVAFILYAWSDILKFRLLLHNIRTEGEPRPGTIGFREDKVREGAMSFVTPVTRSYRLRIIFEMLVPVLIGFYGIFELVRASVNL
jgi:hypothetical protein